MADSAAEAGVEIEEWEVVDLLTSLVDKSLVAYEEDGRGGGRYHLLETVRQYARDRLADDGEGARLRHRHRDQFAAMAEAARAHWNGPGQPEWFDRLDAEHDNLRAALEWCAADADGAPAALRICRACSLFWQARGHIAEARERAGDALEHPGAQERSVLRAGVLNSAGDLAVMQGDFALGRVLLEESLELSRSFGDMRLHAGTLHNLANVADSEGNPDGARALFERALEINRAVGNRAWESINLSSLGGLAYAAGRFLEAGGLFRQSLELRRAIGDRGGVMLSLTYLGTALQALGDTDGADEAAREALALGAELKDRRAEAMGHELMGQIALDRGQFPEAWPWFAGAILRHLDRGERYLICAPMEGIGAAWLGLGRTAPAARLLAASATQRPLIAEPRYPRQEEAFLGWVAAAKHALGEDRFAEEWQAGADLSLEQAIALALDGAGVSSD